MKKVSIVCPAYNESGNIPQLFARVGAVIDGLAEKFAFEVIVFDNCSTDETGNLVLAKCQEDRRWKYVRYSRNFGAEASLLAGIDQATGDAVINLFSDLQDPPELIPQMLELWEQGGEVVYGIVKERNDSSFLKTIGAKIAYWMIYHLTDCKIPQGATDFRLLDRKVVEALTEFRETDRYFRGLVHWVGFKQVHFYYNRSKRVAGRSTANVIYCIKFALNAIVCFSEKPLHMAVSFGFFMIVSSLLAAVLYLGLYFSSFLSVKPPPPGITTIILLIWFNIGINSFFLGVIGEYVGRIYKQGKKRPIYIVDRKANF